MTRPDRSRGLCVAAASADVVCRVRHGHGHGDGADVACHLDDARRAGRDRQDVRRRRDGYPIGADRLLHRLQRRPVRRRTGLRSLRPPRRSCSAAWRSTSSPRCCAWSRRVSRRCWSHASCKASAPRRRASSPSRSMRDCYSGRRMASVMSLAMTALMVVPVIAPTLGQIVVLAAPWRWIFVFLDALRRRRHGLDVSASARDARAGKHALVAAARRSWMRCGRR